MRGSYSQFFKSNENCNGNNKIDNENNGGGIKLVFHFIRYSHLNHNSSIFTNTKCQMKRHTLSASNDVLRIKI